jgi:hypothetical protein
MTSAFDDQSTPLGIVPNMESITCDCGSKDSHPAESGGGPDVHDALSQMQDPLGISL